MEARSSAPAPDPSQATLSRLSLRCPPLPQTLVEAAELIDAPERLEVREVTTVVERDPLVVAQLLNLVNSSYYGLRRTVTTVERAVVLLGPVAVAGIVVGLNMLKMRTSYAGPSGKLVQHLTRHSLAVAYLTRHLLEDAHDRAGNPVSRRADEGAAGFTAGLLHDVGKLVLVRTFPEEAFALYVENAYPKNEDGELITDVRVLEHQVFGCTHTEAGEYVARKFHFAPALVDIARFHHEPMNMPTPQHRRLALAVAAADRLARAIDYGFYNNMTLTEVAEDPFWETLVSADPYLCRNASDLILSVKQHVQPLANYMEAMMVAASAEPKTKAPRRRIPDRLPRMTHTR